MIPYCRIPNLLQVVGFTESGMVQKTRAQQLGETLTVVLKWFVEFQMQLKPENSVKRLYVNISNFKLLIRSMKLIRLRRKCLSKHLLWFAVYTKLDAL